MKSAKVTRKAIEGAKREVNRRARKKVKLVEEVKEEAEEEEDEDQEQSEEEVKQEDVNESDDNVLENVESSGASDDEDRVEEKQPKKVSKRTRRKMKYDAVEEARLERLVFGDPSDVINNLLEREKSVTDDDKYSVTKSLDERNFMKDSEDSDTDDEKFSVKEEDEDDQTAQVGRNAVWVDEDDVEYSVDAALKAQHRKLPRGRPEKVYTELLENKFSQIVGTPKWASLDTRAKEEDEDSDNEILKHSNHLARQKVPKLRKGKIDIKALTDINKSTHTEGPLVTSLQFHPTSTVALVAGLSGILSLFQIDGRENNKLHSIQFEKFRINCAKFLKDGTEVVLGCRHHSYCQAYDLMSGKTYRIPLPHGITNMQKFEVSPDGKFIAIAGRMGQVHLLSGTTKELVANLKMNKRCHALAFSPDSTKLISHGDSEEMYIWDLKSRTCLHKPIDDGCISSAAVAFSPSGQFVATGSKQGVVNIYDTESVLQKRNPSPLKIILNLTTPITNLKFNPTSEILAMASSFKENAFKMVHLPSFTVYANFPTFQTKMHNPLDIDFSPGSGYLGLSNNKGHAYLYRLKHFGNY